MTRSFPALANTVRVGAVLHRVVAATGFVGLWFLPACSAPESSPQRDVQDPGVVHVHGLGINPDNGLLYVATHTGLFRIVGREAERIGETYRDIMGFTVAGADHFLASGHPGAGELDLPPLLGLMESTNAGATWEPLSLLGEADFHALRHTHGRIYGYDSTGGRFMLSEDGTHWEVLSEIVLLDFVVSPEDPSSILGTTEEGVVTSGDGGRRWSDPMAGAPQLTFLAWEQEAALWGLGVDGTVFASDDAGAAWTPRGSIEGPPEALLAHGDVLYAAAHGAGILRSADGGETWDSLYRETREGESGS